MMEIQIMRNIMNETEKRLKKNLGLLVKLESEELNSEHGEQENLKQILLELVFNQKKENDEVEMSCFWERFVKQYFYEQVCDDVKNLSARLSRTNVSGESSHKSETEETVAKENVSNKGDLSNLSQIEQILTVPMEQRKVCSYNVLYKITHFN